MSDGKASISCGGTAGNTAEFTGLGDRPTLLDTLAISRIIIDDYTNGLVDEVYVAYTKICLDDGTNTVIERLWPIEPPAATQAKSGDLLRTDSGRMLGALLPGLSEMKIIPAIWINCQRAISPDGGDAQRHR